MGQAFKVYTPKNIIERMIILMENIKFIDDNHEIAFREMVKRGISVEELGTAYILTMDEQMRTIKKAVSVNHDDHISIMYDAMIRCSWVTGEYRLLVKVANSLANGGPYNLYERDVDVDLGAICDDLSSEYFDVVIEALRIRRNCLELMLNKLN